MTLTVSSPADWTTLRQQGLLMVLDPLIFRAADAFLRGAPDRADQPLWDTISKSVDAFCAFIDAVMLNDQLPIIDYNPSWEPNLAGFAHTLVELCNQDEELLVEVHVDGPAYQDAREPAVELLQQLPEVQPTLAADIRKELSVLDYRWRPRLPELDQLDEEERTIASFRYGGLLFHAYAEAISDRRQPLNQWAEHVLHAKRGLIMLASSLAPDGQLRLNEQKLMRTLRRVERNTEGAIEAIDVRAPTFVPYLLAQDPSSPRDLLRLALRERRGSLVRSYRDWRQDLLADLAGGRIRHSTRQDLRLIAEDVQRKANSDTAVSLHVSYAADWKVLAAAVAGNPAALLGGLALKGKVDDEALRFRLASVLPGRGYRKLLSRIAASQAEYFDLDLALRNLWYRKANSGTN
jgi:hypothetical protein